MSYQDGFYGFFKKLILFVLIVSIVIPLRYDSTNPQYLRIRLLHSILSLKHTFTPDQTRPTLSADYRAFEDIISISPLGDIKPSADPVDTINELRAAFTMGDTLPKSSQCKIAKQVFEHDGHTVDAYWINDRPNDTQTASHRLLVYFHGGGYVMGDIHGYSGLECHLSGLFNITVLHVEYRLSPEHPLPAAVDDAIAVYRSLLHQNHSPSQMIFMGDSAGGGLSLLTIQRLISRQLPVPRAVIALSPWTDLSGSGESYTRNRMSDVMFRNAKNDNTMVTLILGPNPSQLSGDSPLLSPLFGSFNEFPPMYINVGTAEVLEDDSRQVVTKAQNAHVNVTFEEGKHLMHVYPVFYPYYPEARHTLDNIRKWIEAIFD